MKCIVLRTADFLTGKSRSYANDTNCVTHVTQQFFILYAPYGSVDLAERQNLTKREQEKWKKEKILRNEI